MPAELGGTVQGSWQGWQRHQWQIRDTSGRSGTPVAALLHQTAPEAPTAPGVSGHSAPCTGDPVRTGKGHSEVYREDMAEKTRFRKHKTLVTFSFFHPPDIKTVKAKLGE